MAATIRSRDQNPLEVPMFTILARRSAAITVLAGAAWLAWTIAPLGAVLGALVSIPLAARSIRNGAAR
jgi:hypothetical protein